MDGKGGAKTIYQQWKLVTSSCLLNALYELFASAIGSAQRLTAVPHQLLDRRDPCRQRERVPVEGAQKKPRR